MEVAAVCGGMSVASATDSETATDAPTVEPTEDIDLAEFDAPTDADETGGRLHRMRQMGAKRIGSLAIGIGVVGIVLNEMNDLSIVSNSSGVIDVSNIFSVAGQGLNLLVIGVIIAAAAVLLSLWSGF